MSRATSILIVVALGLSTIPLVQAAAGWKAKGTYEPDTSFDRTEGWMTLTPDTSPNQAVRQVYFNGFHGDYDGSFSANSALIGSSLYHGVSYSFYAMLGVW